MLLATCFVMVLPRFLLYEVICKAFQVIFSRAAATPAKDLRCPGCDTARKKYKDWDREGQMMARACYEITLILYA